MNVHVSITIEGWDDLDFWPPTVNCSITNYEGEKSYFIEKYVMVTSKDIDKNTLFPYEESIPCEMIRKWVDENGMPLVEINTEEPHGLVSTNGITNFILNESSIANENT